VSSLFYDGPGQLSTDFLYRDEVPLRPELNTMNTPIRLAHKAVVSAGDACGSVAAIAVDATRDLLKCDSDGRWRHLTTWKNPVTSYATLPATDKAGDVRMVLDKKRAFVYDGSGSWVALAVDQNGDFMVERNLDAGNNIAAGNDMRAGHNVTASHNITASNEVNGVVGVRGGWLQIVDYAEVESLTIKRARRAGDRCHIPVAGSDGSTDYIWPVGSTVVDQNGITMNCYSDRTFRYQNGTYSR
jgi:hypothetical protein